MEEFDENARVRCADMIKRIGLVLAGFVIFGAVFMFVKTRKTASSTYELSQTETAKIADLFKTRPSDAASPNVVIILADDLSWPDIIPGETVNENVVSVMDMLPTLTKAAGVEGGWAKDIDGINRWDAILGKGTKTAATR